MSSNKRTPHALKREKNLAMPRHVVLVDTETTQYELPGGQIAHRLKLGWACYYRQGEPRRAPVEDWLYYVHADNFWAWLLARLPTKSKLWVIAHNMSFDFTVLEGFAHLLAAGFKVKFFYCSASTTLISVRGGGRSIMFVDSLNWFKESLATIGDRLGVKKLSIDFEKATDAQLKTYCRRDVEILLVMFKSLVRFLTGNRLARLCPTIASTAMAAYLLRHYNHTVYIHNNQEAIDLERAAYCGGRTECFFLGHLSDGPYYLLDVNSLYAFVMRGNRYPVKYRRMIHQPSNRQTGELLQEFAAVGECLVETDLPIYALKKYRTIFPVGRFWAALTGPEIAAALRLGHLQAVKTLVIYEQADIFTGFVDRFYRLRQEFKSAGVPLYEHFCKLLLNSLYGKFGQKAEIWSKIGAAPGEPDRFEDLVDADTGCLRRLRYLLGEVWELTRYDEARHSFPAIAAYVTSYARLYLWKLLQQAGKGNCFYCDTDSLFVNQTGLINLGDYLGETNLGQLKVEDITQELFIKGLKDYCTDSKSIIKGVAASAIKLSETDYQVEQWPTLQGMLDRGDTAVYKNILQHYHLNRQYLKGCVLSGGSIVPFVLHDSPDLFPPSAGPA